MRDFSGCKIMLEEGDEFFIAENGILNARNSTTYYWSCGPVKPADLKYGIPCFCDSVDGTDSLPWQRYKAEQT